MITLAPQWHAFSFSEQLQVVYNGKSSKYNMEAKDKELSMIEFVNLF